jgi:hypothetical protein
MNRFAFQICAASIAAVMCGGSVHADERDIEALLAEAEEAMSDLWLLGYGGFEITGCVVRQSVTTNRRDGGFIIHDAAFNLADLQPIETIRADQVFEMRGERRFARAYLVLRPERSGALAALSFAFISSRAIDAQVFAADFAAHFGDEVAMRDVFERTAASMQQDLDRLMSDALWQDLAAFRQVEIDFDPERGTQLVGFDFPVGYEVRGGFDLLRPPSLWGPAEDVDLALTYLERIQTELCPPPS